MKRRNFLKVLGVAAAVPVVAKVIPKSKPESEKPLSGLRANFPEVFDQDESEKIRLQSLKYEIMVSKAFSKETRTAACKSLIEDYNLLK